jgi:hypothetical protein
MQLVRYSNSSEINGNHQNNVLTIAMVITDVLATHCYSDPVTLMLKWAPKLHLGSILDIRDMHEKLGR